MTDEQRAGQSAPQGKPHWTREVRRFDWSALEPRASLLCVPAIAVALILGIASGHRGAAMVMAGGAQSVGFGSFQKRLWFRGGPMVLATIGASLSASVGEVAANHHVALVLLAMVWAFAYGMSGAISSPASWVGQQCCIFLVVSSAVPGTLGEAGMRGLGVLAGGALQSACVLFLWRFFPPAKSALDDPVSNPPGWQVRAVMENLTPESEIFRYALRLAMTAILSMILYHSLPFPNAYWVPMTALIILKPDWLLTQSRAIARLGGTMIGAALATLIAEFLRPGDAWLIALVLVFIYGAYAMQNVNYGIFAVWLTGYIAFLLAIGQLPPRGTAEHRVVATAIGGAVAMLVHAIHMRLEQRRLFHMLRLSPGSGSS